MLGEILQSILKKRNIPHTSTDRRLLELWKGAVGLLSFQLARAMGAGRVFVIGRKHRLALAETMGAVPIDFEKGDPVDKIKSFTGGKGVDMTIDCAGTAQTVQQAVTPRS